LIIKGLARRGGAKISLPARDDALIRKRTSATIVTGLIYSHSTFTSHCRACQDSPDNLPNCSSYITFGPTSAIIIITFSKIVGRALREPVNNNINLFITAECALIKKIFLIHDHAYLSSVKERLLANRSINLTFIELYGYTSVIVVFKKGI
jgi:hypothetical protein